MNRFAFTLSEALIVMGIIAILATLSLTAVSGARPDEEVVMFRKAYSTTVKCIEILLGSGKYYPNANFMSSSSGGGELNKEMPIELAQGFEDFEITDEAKEVDSGISSSNKFVILFVDQLNTVGLPTFSGSTASFSTGDGIYWEITDNFSSAAKSAEITIYPNGEESKAKSCTYNSTTCKEPNKFVITVYKNGRISTSDTYVKAMIKNPTVNKSKTIRKFL